MRDLLDGDYSELSHVFANGPGASRAEVDREWHREQLDQDLEAEQWLLEIDSDGQLVLGSGQEQAHAHALTFQAKYLSQAVNAANAGQLSLEFSAPIGPLAIRRTDDPNSFSALMPIRPEIPGNSQHPDLP